MTPSDGKVSKWFLCVADDVSGGEMANASAAPSLAAEE